jgi:hypothetical protein
MEQGFQTEVEPAKAAFYHGIENDRRVLPPSLGRGLVNTTEGPAPDQATQLTDALSVAYCQPAVAAFFNFELADEPGLAGWQSGLLWTDHTPKPSYQSFKAAVRNVASGRVDCARYAQAADVGGAIGFWTTPAKPPSIVIVK